MKKEYSLSFITAAKSLRAAMTILKKNSFLRKQRIKGQEVR